MLVKGAPDLRIDDPQNNLTEPSRCWVHVGTVSTASNRFLCLYDLSCYCYSVICFVKSIIVRINFSCTRSQADTYARQYSWDTIFAIACACTTHVLTITKMCSRIRALHDRPTLLKNEKLQPPSTTIIFRHPDGFSQGSGRLQNFV